LLLPSGAHAQRALYFSDVTLIDARSPTPRPHQSVLIERGKIVAVGRDVARPRAPQGGGRRRGGASPGSSLISTDVSVMFGR
jgi:hypothetical protein